MAIVLITGGTGLIGTHLTQRLQREGHTVRYLSRTAGERNGIRAYAWDIPARRVDPQALEGVDHIVHLSGAGVVDKRWTKARMHELYASRVDAALLLLEVARAAGVRPRSFGSASGINYYGAVTTDHVFTEADEAATDTIGTLTHAWEQAADAWDVYTRVVKLRTPMVLAREGGALPVFARLARWGVLSPLGDGRHWMPWVHINDLVEVYVHALRDDRMTGAYNVVADQQPTNAELMEAIARELHRPFFLPKVPAFALHARYGEMADLLLTGSRASGERLRAVGLAPRFQRPADALQDLLG